MIKQDLHENWTVHAVDGARLTLGSAAIAATVPGTVHVDLLAAGLIPDPYTGTHEVQLAWMHRVAWQYDTTFKVAPPAAGERVDLVFDGLDTVATIVLNGVELGRTANMHRGYRFDARRLLSEGDGALSVRLDPALTYAEAVRDSLGARPHTNKHPYNMVRKMAASS